MAYVFILITVIFGGAYLSGLLNVVFVNMGSG